MTISQHLVSWILIVGLILGLYGFFFLSTGIFGSKSIPWFRMLLPATGMALGAFLFGSYLDLGTVFDILPVPVLFSVVTFVLVYFLGRYMPTESESEARRTLRQIVGFAVFNTIVGIVVIAISVAAYQMGSATIEDLWLGIRGGIGWSLYFWMALPIFLPRMLSEQRLVKVGFLLSAIAILTQFIPPVLDVLNIPNTKP